MRDSGVIFEPIAHTYEYNGKFLKGITGMISKHLFPSQYKDVPKYILDRAARRGTEIHERLITTDMFDEVETEEQADYLAMKQQYNINVLDSEYLVTDFEHFATAIDKVFKIGDDMYLGDVKTTYVLNKEYLSWQLSIGHYLFNLVNPDIEIKGYKAIWVKDGVTLHDIEPIPMEEVKKLLNAEINGEEYQNFNVATIESNKALMLIQQIEMIEAQAKEATKAKEDLRERLHKLFVSHGVDKWENDSFVISKVKPYKKPVFDKKRFEKDYPELDKEYTKQTNVKGSIRFKSK